MSAVKSVARFGLHSLGGLNAVRWWNRGGVRILGYHHFPAEQRPWFEWQCAWIRKHYEPVSLHAIADSLDSGKSLPPNALAVTVDDGFADFFDTGYPVFQSYGIPATVFLVSDFLDRRGWLWWNRIVWVFEHTSKLGSEAERNLAMERTLAEAKTMPNAARLALCDQLAEDLGVRLPAEPPSKWLPMSWDQVRVLHGKGVEFGAHTVTHPILSTVEDPAALREEIVGSKRRIEEELGAAVEHFAYPNGRWQDIGDAADRIVRTSGFRTAVSYEGGLNYQPDRFLLRRLGPDLNENRQQFAELVSGIHHLSHR